METSEKKQKNNSERNKSISPEEIQKRKKMLVYLLMASFFVGAMYLIFSPSKKEKKEQEAQQGINLSVPQVSGADLLTDKEDAYEQANREAAEKEKLNAMAALSDYFSDSGQADNLPQGEPVYEPYSSHNSNSIQNSASAYKDIKNTLGNFYEDNSQTEELQKQIEELKEQLSSREKGQNEDDETEKQLALMEKSYQIASKYMPQGTATNNSAFATAKQPEEKGQSTSSNLSSGLTTRSVQPGVKSIVSSLYQNVSDSVFIAEQSKERNRYFHSSISSNDELLPEKNTLKVVVYQTTTLKDGEMVKLRLLETARVEEMFIPRNSLLTATAKLQGNRMFLFVTSIAYKERIVGVKLSAFDTDAQEGVFIPGSVEINAVKEIAAGMGQSAGTSFTLNFSAGQQLAADVGKGVLQGASQYLGNKMREIKVTLKSGHRLFLLEKQ